MIKNTTLIALLGVAVSGIAVAAEGKLAPADTTFVHKAAEGAMAEVKLGEFRQEWQSATGPDVRQFATQTLPREEHLRLTQNTSSQWR